MSAFKDLVEQDIHNVFLDIRFFGELRTVEYEGQRYQDIPVVLMEPEERQRSTRKDDHVQGLYRVVEVLYCALSDLRDKLPEAGQRLSINDQEGGGGFFHQFYVAASTCKMGMLEIELGAFDE